MVLKSQVDPSMLRDTNSKKLCRMTRNVWKFERAMGFQVGDIDATSTYDYEREHLLSLYLDRNICKWLASPLVAVHVPCIFDNKLFYNTVFGLGGTNHDVIRFYPRALCNPSNILFTSTQNPPTRTVEYKCQSSLIQHKEQQVQDIHFF